MTKEIRDTQITYIKELSNQIIKSLEAVQEEQKVELLNSNSCYIFSSKYRATFDRLRLELNRQLLLLKKQIY